MSETLIIAEQLASFLFLPAETTLARTRQLLQEAHASFAIIMHDNHPQALLYEQLLSSLSQDQDKTLGDVLTLLSPLLLVDIDAEESTFESKDMQQLALLLKRTQAQGVVVQRDEHIIGVLARSSIRQALSVSPVPVPGSEKRLDGNEGVKPRTYVCRKCSLPYPRRRPRQGNAVPLCPREPELHGLMEREDV